jgi:hypothetical protein
LVLEARRGAEAVTLLSTLNRSLQLVVSDIAMPSCRVWIWLS